MRFYNFLPAAVLFIYSFTNIYGQAGSVCPQDLLPEKNEKGLWGYTDIFGRWEVEPVFTGTYPFSGNKAIVKKGRQIGVIGCDGYLILQPIYDDITPLNTGRFWVSKGGKWSLVEVNGKILAANIYDEVKEAGLEARTAWVRRGDKWGLFNKAENNYLIMPQFELMQLLSEKAALVKKDELFGVVDNTTGQFLVKPAFSTVKKINQNMVVYTENNLRGLMTEEGVVVTPARYDTVIALNRFVYKVSKNFRYGLTDYRGKEMTEATYDSIGDFAETVAVVKKDNAYGYININGKSILPLGYTEARAFSKGSAVVKTNAGYQLINKKGEPVSAVYSSMLRDETRAYVAAGGSGAWYLLNTAGTKITSETFSKIYPTDSGAFVRVEQNGKIGFYNTDSSAWAVEPAYEAAEAFYLNYAIVSLGGKQGLINTAGKVVIPAQYESVSYEPVGKSLFFKVKKSGQYGLLSPEGKTEIPAEYEELVQAERLMFKAKKNGLYGLIKLNNTPVSEFGYAYMSHAVNQPATPDFPAIVMQKSKYALLADNGTPVMKPAYDKMTYAGESFYRVYKKNKSGIIDAKGMPVVPIIADDFGYFSEKLIAAKLADKWGYYLSTGTQRVAPKFDEAYPFTQYMAVVKENGKYGVIDPFGKYVIQPEFDQFQLLPNGDRRLTKDHRTFNLESNAYLRYIPTIRGEAFVSKNETMKNNPAGAEVLLTGTAFYTDSKQPATGQTVVVKNEKGEVLERCTTGTGGHFVFRKLPPGNYLMAIEPATTKIGIKAAPYPESEAVMKMSKEEIERFNYRVLNKEGSFVNIALSGKLSTVAGVPLSSDWKLLLMDEANNVVDVCEANNEGYFAFRRLKPSNYSIIPVGVGEKIAAMARMVYEDPHLYVNPAVLTRYDYKLLKELPVVSGDRINIAGMVTLTAGGKPAKDVGLLLIDDSGKVVRRSVSNSDGVFSFEYLPAAGYRVVMEIYNPDVKTEIQVFSDDSKLTFADAMPVEINVCTIFYGVNEDEFSSDAKKLLDKFAADYKMLSPERININTYGDASGTFEYNLKLTQRRGEKVKNYLVTKGLDPGIIKINAYGKALVAAGGNVGYNPKLNRKADLKVTLKR